MLQYTYDDWTIIASGLSPRDKAFIWLCQVNRIHYENSANR